MFRQDVLPYAGLLLPVIIGHILDTASVKKQEIAVKTLGKVGLGWAGLTDGFVWLAWCSAMPRLV